MSGECKTYNLRKPMSWSEFCEMPLDLRKEYAEWLERTFLFSAEQAEKLFYITGEYWMKYRRGILGFEPFRGKRRSPTIKENASFERWRTGASADKVEDEVVAVEAETENAEQKKEEMQEMQEAQEAVKRMVSEGQMAVEKSGNVLHGDLTIRATPLELLVLLTALIGSDKKETFRVSWGE